MKALTKILGFAVAALIVVALGFYFIEVYAPSPPLAGFEVTTEGRRASIPTDNASTHVAETPSNRRIPYSASHSRGLFVMYRLWRRYCSFDHWLPLERRDFRRFCQAGKDMDHGQEHRHKNRQIRDAVSTS